MAGYQQTCDDTTVSFKIFKMLGRSLHAMLYVDDMSVVHVIFSAQVVLAFRFPGSL